MEEIGIARYKIPSGEVTNLPLLRAVAATGKPVLLSSGMSDWAELDSAVDSLRASAGEITVLQCTSQYPTPDERVGLNVIPEMAARWRLPVGYSDHTLDNHAAFAAVALGATVVEKHLTFSRAMYGSDARHSAEPEQFADLVRGLRAIARMVSRKVDKDDLAPFRDMKAIFEKSVVAVRDIAAGTELTDDLLTVKKPGSGIPAAQFDDLLGRRAKRDLKGDSLLTWDDVGDP